MPALMNRGRTDALMSTCRLDGIIVGSPGNVVYFSDYSNWLDGQLRDWMVKPDSGSDAIPTFAVIAHGEVTLVIDALFEPNARDLDVADVVTFGPYGEAESPQQALRLAVDRRGLANGDLGIEAAAFSTNRRAEITAELSAARLRDCSQMLRLIRAVKSSEEIARLREAAALNEQALNDALQTADRTDLELDQIAQRFACRLASSYADLDHFAYGFEGRGIAARVPQSIRPGDVLYIDFGCKHRSVYADSGITLAADELTPDLAEAFAALCSAIEAGVAALKPGARCSEVYAAMRPEGAAATSYVHGHSLGVEMRDLPLLVESLSGSIEDDCIVESADLCIERDMVINLEAPLFLPGIASLHVEQTFLVTGGGAEPLVEQPRERPVILRDRK